MNSDTHPDYNPQNLDHNVGIIEVDRRIEFSSHIASICLPYLPMDSDGYMNDEDVNVVGYGSNTDASNGLLITSNQAYRNLQVSAESLPIQICRVHAYVYMHNLFNIYTFLFCSNRDHLTEADLL